MSNYQIITDSGCDLSAQMLETMQIKAVPLSVNFRGKTLDDSVDAGIQEIYAGLRAGEAASTSAVNPDRWASLMERILRDGEDVLAVAFSSGLSATYQSAVIAAEDLKETYPDRKILVVDSLCASLGQGLLLYYAAQKRDEGLSLEELAAWLEENKRNLCLWFTVDDLVYLKRGGRVSPTVAFVGTVLGIKPVLHVDNEGKLVSVTKVRGRKAALNALVEKFGELSTEKQGTIFISHADCLAEAEEIKTQFESKYDANVEVITDIGPVIGAHSGPGTMAVFFIGKER